MTSGACPVAMIVAGTTRYQYLVQCCPRCKTYLVLQQSAAGPIFKCLSCSHAWLPCYLIQPQTAF